jgi:hypothetical protein
MVTAVGFGIDIITNEDAFEGTGLDFGDVDVLDEDEGLSAKLTEMG